MLHISAAGAVLFLLPLWSGANDNAHHAVDATASNGAPIKITINPESRVSATLGGPLPAPAPCGSVTELPVRIVNQGFVTAQLEAVLVGNAPPGVAIEFHPEPLKGLPDEFRTIRITLMQPGYTDLTIGFRAHNGARDLGGRDRIHFLLRCLPTA